MRRRIAIGADHGGLVLKNELVSRLKKEYDVSDLGAHAFNQEDDYPDFVGPVARAVVYGEVERGVLVCGSGVGACIAANKFPGIRACLCHDTYSARQGVEDDDMNVLCLGARVVGVELAAEVVTAFLNAGFKDTGAYKRRLNKVMEIERQALQGGRP